MIAPLDLQGLAALIKPAVLYADRVTIHSPTAALLHGVTEFAELTDPADQLAAILEVARQAPTALPLDFDPEEARGFEAFLRMSPQQRAMFRRMTNAGDELRAIDEMVDSISRIWEKQMPHVLAQIIDMTGSRELVAAIRAGAVEVAPLGDRTPTDHLSSTVIAATTPREDRQPDPMFDGFLETIVEVVSGAGGFPLLDGDAVGLVQSMERESLVVFDGSTARRSSEVDAATRFMAFLPYFPHMPLDEVLDLKRELGPPLARFRSEMVKLARDFARPIDDTFVADVENAWRGSVAPALADIREALAEHGLLQEVASIALGDVRRLVSEAGGVMAASHAKLINLSQLVTIAAAAAVPALDTLAKAVNDRMAAKRDVMKQGFYFLHKIDKEAQRRA
ncbi:MAG: hypothetical protein ACR2KK_06435 [Acidimicrobiales bacterium]